jgi:serine/threonine protein phosphatase 1
MRGQASGRFLCLRGNHEELLTGAAARDRSDRSLLTWWANGGEQTLDSYGVKDPSDIPQEHLGWIERLPVMLKDGERLFVHAGIRPSVPIADQDEKDLTWIREPFLSFEGSHGTLVVHGHTPTRSRLPDLRANRLNLDTGACLGGPLTAALFSSGEAKPLMFVNETGTTW